ncbi:MBL fold metallo-hydrolase [bacterium]|nr:MBL fold metallo-hydrolase [bacterium]
MIREIIWNKCKILHFSLGKYKIDGGVIFGLVPKVMWKKHFKVDENNYLELNLNTILIQCGKSNIIIDTGLGTKMDDRLRKILAVDSVQDILGQRLAELNLTPDDITHVIPTHLHFDHCGGNTKIQDDETVPCFPKAKYIFQKKEWDDAMSPDERTRGTYFQDNFAPIPQNMIKFIDGNETIADDQITLQYSGAHSCGHQMIRIKGTGSSDFIFTGDMFPLRTNINLPWVSATDLFPRDTLNFKRTFLKEALENQHVLALSHETEKEKICTVIKNDKGKYLARAY